ALYAIGNGDAWLHTIAAGSHQLALRIDLEVTVARVAHRAVRQQDLKEAAAAHRDIETVAGRLHVSLRVLLFRRYHTNASTQRQASRRDRVLRGRAANLAHVLIQQLLEHRAALFVTRGIDVGEVVGRDGHARLLRIESGFGGPQGWVHDEYLEMSNW